MYGDTLTTYTCTDVFERARDCPEKTKKRILVSFFPILAHFFRNVPKSKDFRFSVSGSKSYPAPRKCFCGHRSQPPIFFATIREYINANTPSKRRRRISKIEPRSLATRKFAAQAILLQATPRAQFIRLGAGALRD